MWAWCGVLPPHGSINVVYVGCESKQTTQSAGGSVGVADWVWFLINSNVLAVAISWFNSMLN